MFVIACKIARSHVFLVARDPGDQMRDFRWQTAGYAAARSAARRLSTTCTGLRSGPRTRGIPTALSAYLTRLRGRPSFAIAHS